MSCQPCGCDYEAQPVHLCAHHAKWPDWGKKVSDTTTQVATGSPTSIRLFETGATRDVEHDKYDYEGFLSPLVLERYAAYMHKNRMQKDGSVRDSDNWQKGIPLSAYMKSMWRHFWEIWSIHRRANREGLEQDFIEEALCGVMFNSMGYLYEILKKRHP